MFGLLFSFKYDYENDISDLVAEIKIWFIHVMNDEIEASSSSFHHASSKIRELK